MSFIPLYALSIWRKEDDVFIVNLPTFEKRCETPAGRGAKPGRGLLSFNNHNYYQFAEWMERPTRCLALCSCVRPSLQMSPSNSDNLDLTIMALSILLLTLFLIVSLSSSFKLKQL